MPGDPAGLRLDAVDVRHPGRGGATRILAINDLSLAAGTLCGIAGPSGSGKTTLLHLVGGLLAPGQGGIWWNGTEVTALPGRDRDAWRRRHAGFIFQEFHLIGELSALDNVLLPVWFAAASARTRRAEAHALLARVGIATPGRRAAVLSRGEQQRVAIARALLHRPALILADEPTASLDDATAAVVGDLLVAATRESGATLLMASHDQALLARMDRVIHLRGGRLA